MIECPGAGGGLNAFTKPGFKLFIDQLAPLCVSHFGVEHLDESLALLEFFIVAVDPLVPANQFIVKTANLSAFVHMSGRLVEFVGYGFSFAIEEFGCGWNGG